MWGVGVVCECVWEQSHGFKTAPHMSPTCMLLWGTPNESLKCRIQNSGVLKTSRADSPHLQLSVWGGGVKPQGSEKGHPRGVRDHSSGGGQELKPREREGKEGGEGRGLPAGGWVIVF